MSHSDQHPAQPSSHPGDPLARYLTAGPSCPDWCEHRDSHPFELDPWEEDPARRWHRLHTRPLPHAVDPHLHASVQQLDHAAAPDEPPTRQRPTVLLEPDHGAIELAGPHELRQLAGLLDKLADDLAARFPDDLGGPDARQECDR